MISELMNKLAEQGFVPSEITAAERKRAVCESVIRSFAPPTF